jgi:hypothetical protein
LAEPGLITEQVIDKIVNAPLVIADLTSRNPNVFYELALRHLLRRPLVQIIEEGEEIPFDIAVMRTILVNHETLEDAEAAKKAIVDQIRALERAGSPMVTPTSFLGTATLSLSNTGGKRWRAIVLASLSLFAVATATIGYVAYMTGATRTTQQLQAERIEVIQKWISCQDKEGVTKRPHSFNWATLECIDITTEPSTRR